MNKPAFFTIIANNYTHFALTLFQSLRATGSTAKLFCVICDSYNKEVETALQALSVDIIYDRMILGEHLTNMSFRYDITEYSTSAKPFAFEYLFLLGYTQVTYLDPDIYVTGGLEQLLAEDQFTSVTAILTPHSTVPVDDYCRPSDIDFLRCGVFNLGYITINNGEESHQLLQWWKQKCASYCDNNQEAGLFVDQKWCDLLPVFFDSIYICKDLGFNAAYWNAHYRTLTRKDSIDYVNNSSFLYFFHFSGFNPLLSDRLSKYTSRHAPISDSALSSLASEFSQLLVANGYHSFSLIPYSYNYFSNNVLIGSLIRHIYAASEETKFNPFAAPGDFYCKMKSLNMLQRSDLKIASYIPRAVKPVNEGIYPRTSFPWFYRLFKVFCIIFGPARISRLLANATKAYKYRILPSLFANARPSLPTFHFRS